MLKDNLKLLLLVIAIVQMPLVGFAMFSADQLKNINVLVQDMREDAFNDEVIDPKKVDDLIKSYNQKFYKVFEKNLSLSLEEFTYNGTKTSLKKESYCYKKAKMCESNRWKTFKDAIKNDDAILLEYTYINDPKYYNSLIVFSVEDNKPNCFEFFLKKNFLTKKRRNQFLIEAALKNSTDVVKLLLEKGADVNAKNYQGLTALMGAIQKEHTGTVEMLLTYDKINVNKKDNQGFTALVYAIKKGNTKLVEMLLTHPKIDVNLQNNQGFTPLMCAIQKGNTEIVKRLLKHKDIKVNLQNQQGYTALMGAIQMGNTEIVELLLDRDDIKVNLKDNGGLTPLVYAIESKNTEIVEKLLKHKDIKVNLQTNQGFTPLMCAIKSKNTAIVKMLLNRKDIKVNLQTQQGFTALMGASLMGYTEIVEKLLDRDDIKVNLQENLGFTALMCAILMGHTETVEMLLTHAKIDVNLKNYEGLTALMCAILIGNTKIVELLLTHAKIDVNEKDNLGCTALMGAIESNHTEIVELLLDRDDIKVNLKDNQDYTALMYAIKYGNIKIIKMLLIKKPNTFGVFSTAIRFNYLELVLELLNHNLKPWEDGYLNIDQTTARLFVRWYTQEDEEEVTINGIIKNGEEKELSDEELLERFDFHLQKKEADIPQEFSSLLKEIINPSQKKPLVHVDTSPKIHIHIWEPEKLIQGETLHKAPTQKKSESQKKRKTEYKEIKPEEKENNLSFNKVKGYLIVYRFFPTASKRLDKNDFYNGIKVIQDCIKALSAAGIIFVFELNGGNHYQLRVDGTLPEFACEFFNSYSKPNVISPLHGGNKVYSDQFNQLISYLIYFMVLVLQQGDKQPGYTECWEQLQEFKYNGQLNIKLLNELYPGIRWVDM